MTDNNPIPASARVFDEFSPKKIILQASRAAIYIRSKWKIIGAIALAAGLGGAVYSYFKKPDYVAELTFALDEGAAQSARSGLSEVGEELGIGSSYDAGGVFSSITNIVELMQSRLLIEKTLRSSVNTGNRWVTFADFFLDSLDYRDQWIKKSPYYRSSFPLQKRNKADTLFENNVLRNMYETILAKNIKLDKKGKGTTIIAVTCSSHHELFSKFFLEALIDEVTRYYIETKTQRAKINLAFLQKRTDSVREAYNDALYGRAAYADEHINSARQISLIANDKRQTDIQILRSSYVELTKSLEVAKTTLIKETPLIQYLDIPILPLKTLRSNMIKFFFIFFFLGAFLAAGTFAVKKWWAFIMAT